MTAGNPRVSVLIVNYNGRHHLQECLQSVLAQTYSNIEVVMVDNASRDGSREFVATEFPTVKMALSEVNLGFAGGNNFGAGHCTGEYVYFLNNDVCADPDAVSALMRAREHNPEYAVFGSLLLNYADPEKLDSAGDFFYWAGPVSSFSDYPAALFDRPRSTMAAKGAAVLYPRALLDTLGWFDADFFLNFEDIDLSLRAWHAGKGVMMVPQSRIRHKSFGTLGSRTSALTYYYGERNFLWVVLKNFPAWALFRFLPGLIYVKIIQAKAAIKDRQFSAYFRGNLASLGSIPKMLAKRRGILGKSRLDAQIFKRLLRMNMRSEFQSFHRGEYNNLESPASLKLKRSLDWVGY